MFGVEAKRHVDQYFILNVRRNRSWIVCRRVMEFAVLAEDGSVLFHSEEALSLKRNFLEEVNNRDTVREWTASGHKVTWSGDYHGRPHRLHIQAMPAFIDCPWRIVTFQEMEPALEAQLQQQRAILRLGLLNLVVLLALVGFFWMRARAFSRRVRDILIFRRSTTIPAIGRLAGLSAVATVLIVWTYYPGANAHLDSIYIFFVALPVLAIITAVAARRDSEDEQPELSNRWHVFEVILLLATIAVAPAIGFARIAYRVQETVNTERWLELAGQRWEARRGRVLDRVNGPAYSADTRTLLVGASGFARDWTAAGEPVYSYLTQIPRVQLLGPNDAPGTGVSASGQEFIRYVLAWSPVTTTDAPGKPQVAATAEAPQFRLPPRVAGHTPAFSAGLESGGLFSDISVIRAVVGVAILIGAAWALCWARRRLTVPPFLTVQTLAQQISSLPPKGLEAILLIGPPRTRKDEAVRNAIIGVSTKTPPPAEPIRLLDRELNDAYVDAESKRIDDLVRRGKAQLACDGRLLIHAANPESQLITVKTRTYVLKLLEKLFDRKDNQVSRVLVVTTSVDPIANFEEVFYPERQGVYDDAVPEVELGRSSLLLSRFRRCYTPILCECSSANRWRNWLNYDPKKWEETLQLEDEGYEPLAGVVGELGRSSWKEPSLEDLARAFTSRAEATYQLLWTSALPKSSC